MIGNAKKSSRKDRGQFSEKKANLKTSTDSDVQSSKTNENALIMHISRFRHYLFTLGLGFLGLHQ